MRSPMRVTLAPCLEMDKVYESLSADSSKSRLKNEQHGVLTSLTVLEKEQLSIFWLVS
jgi:hypothetical protein